MEAPAGTVDLKSLDVARNKKKKGKKKDYAQERVPHHHEEIDDDHVGVLIHMHPDEGLGHTHPGFGPSYIPE